MAERKVRQGVGMKGYSARIIDSEPPVGAYLPDECHEECWQVCSDYECYRQCIDRCYVDDDE